MKSHHIVLTGTMTDGTPANTMQAKMVKSYINDKGSVTVRKIYTKGVCYLQVKTAKGEYILNSTNRENTAFEGKLGDIEARAKVKKIVAHLYYWV